MFDFKIRYDEVYGSVRGMWVTLSPEVTCMEKKNVNKMRIRGKKCEAMIGKMRLDSELWRTNTTAVDHRKPSITFGRPFTSTFFSLPLPLLLFIFLLLSLHVLLLLQEPRVEACSSLCFRSL